MNNHDNREESKRDFVTDPSLQHAIKKTRWKQVILYIFISIVTLCISMAFILFGSQHLITKKIERDSEHQSNLLMKSMSLTSGGGHINYNLFSATGKTIYYKRIGDREIVWDTETRKYPVFGKVEVIDRGSGLIDVIAPDKDTRFIRYNHFNNERIIDFYYPQFDYNRLPKELAVATKLDKNKLIEVALSFDKPRKAKDVKESLGSKNVDWLWINTTSKKRMKELKTMQNDFQKVKHGEKAEGLTTKLEFSQFKENPANQLVSGAVVSGTPADLKRFEQIDYIRASVIGVTIDKY